MSVQKPGEEIVEEVQVEVAEGVLEDVRRRLDRRDHDAGKIETLEAIADHVRVRVEYVTADGRDAVGELLDE